MEQRLEMLGERLFKNIKVIQKLWLDIFGSNFDKNWDKPELALRNIVNISRETLNLKGSRNGHATLFLRDPLSDRLILKHSTNKELNPGFKPDGDYFIERNSNYDDQLHTCYYALCDRLTPAKERKLKDNRKTRGLTGWVAVSGHFLRVNSERSKSRLEEITNDHPDTQESCKRYGKPLWGNRIKEFLEDPSSKKWSKRFLAVPIKSLVDKSLVEHRVTIGVLRYTCMLTGEVLDQIDLHFLESIAELISAVINTERAKIVFLRQENLPLAIKKFEETGYINDFLHFIAYHLNSKIVSLYFPIKCNGINKLRLFDAYGISGNIGDLRLDNRIKDYIDDRNVIKGLTMDIYHSDDDGIKIYSSVLDSKHWEGINTETFYLKALSNLGIINIQDQLDDLEKRKKLLETFSIKLMGKKLKDFDNNLGVLKVEFPSAFDSDYYYDNTEDRKFFTDCAEVLKKELVKYKRFISGQWFEKANETNVKEFIRMLSQIISLRLLEGCDLSDFWTKVKNYAQRYANQIKQENERIYTQFPQQKRNIIFQSLWQHIKGEPIGLFHLIFSEALQRLF